MESDKIPNYDSQFLDVPFCLHDPVFLFANDVSLTYFDITLDSDDSNAPANDETVSLYCGNNYINKAGNLAFGVEDEEGNAVGTDAADIATMDFTA